MITQLQIEKILFQYHTVIFLDKTFLYTTQQNLD